MYRREFMTKTALASTLCCTSSFLSASASKSTLAVYDINWKFNLSHHNGKECSVWIPLPCDISGTQNVLQTGAKSDADRSFHTIHNAYESPTLYAHWDKNAMTKTLALSLRVAITDRQCDFKRKRISPDAFERAQEFLAPTAHIPIDGTVAKVAKKIVGTQQEPLKKARKIYDWIIANSYRDENVHGCGVGSPNAMLAQLERDGRMGGKCLDMSALCVALMRSSGIPAREVMGIRVGPSRLSNAFSAKEDITKSQHCKLEFFIPTMGWIPCDPADITKLILKENLEKTSPRVLELANLFFSFWENNWMALNHARDFDLYPANTQGTLDSFGYVYGEADGEYLDPFEPTKYHYTIISKKLAV